MRLVIFVFIFVLALSSSAEAAPPTDTIRAVASYRGVDVGVLTALAARSPRAGRGRMGLREEGLRVRQASTSAEADFQALDQVARELAEHLRRISELAPQVRGTDALRVALVAYDCGDLAEAVAAHLEDRVAVGEEEGRAASILAAGVSP